MWKGFVWLEGNEKKTLINHCLSWLMHYLLIFVRDIERHREKEREKKIVWFLLVKSCCLFWFISVLKKCFCSILKGSLTFSLLLHSLQSHLQKVVSICFHFSFFPLRHPLFRLALFSVLVRLYSLSNRQATNLILFCVFFIFFYLFLFFHGINVKTEVVCWNYLYILLPV